MKIVREEDRKNCREAFIKNMVGIIEYQLLMGELKQHEKKDTLNQVVSDILGYLDESYYIYPANFIGVDISGQLQRTWRDQRT